MEVKHSSEAIQILSPSLAMSCSLEGTPVEALHNPTIGTSIMSEFPVKNLLGNMPLISTNQLFKSPLGLFFKCCGIARDMPIIIDKTKVHLDFHIYAILEFDLLVGHPRGKLFPEKPFHGGLDEKLGTTASATPIPCPKHPMTKHFPNHNPFEEAKFISSFVSPKLACETECIPSPHSNPSHVPLANRTLFEIVIKIQH
jgi:hypothetical protein